MRRHAGMHVEKQNTYVLKCSCFGCTHSPASCQGLCVFPLVHVEHTMLIYTPGTRSPARFQGPCPRAASSATTPRTSSRRWEERRQQRSAQSSTCTATQARRLSRRCPPCLRRPRPRPPPPPSTDPPAAHSRQPSHTTTVRQAARSTITQGEGAAPNPRHRPAQSRGQRQQPRGACPSSLCQAVGGPLVGMLRGCGGLGAVFSAWPQPGQPMLPSQKLLANYLPHATLGCVQA